MRLLGSCYLEDLCSVRNVEISFSLCDSQSIAININQGFGIGWLKSFKVLH